MPSFLYKPDCPMSNEDGFITKDDYYEYLYLYKEDKNMMIGNRRVVIRYNSDFLEPTRHMALPVGSAPIDSKSKFRKITKQNKCVEVGNEVETLVKPRKRHNLGKKQRREDIKRAVWEVKNGASQALYEIRNGKRG